MAGVSIGLHDPICIIPYYTMSVLDFGQFWAVYNKLETRMDASAHSAGAELVDITLQRYEFLKAGPRHG